MKFINALYFMVVFITYASYSLNNKGAECEKNGPCVCTYPNDLEINLQTLNASYLTTADSKVFMYIYSPCQDFAVNKSEPNKKSALWLFNATIANSTVDLDPAKVISGAVNGTFTELACVDTAKFTLTGYGSNEATIEYQKDTTISKVVLDCSQAKTVFSVEPEFKPTPSLAHSLILRGDIACAKLVVPPDNHHLSTGSVLVIMLFTFIIIYLLCGMLLLKFLRGANGLEMIPNIDFWSGLPSLVRDGFMFAISCGRGEDSYERI